MRQASKLSEIRKILQFQPKIVSHRKSSSKSPPKVASQNTIPIIEAQTETSYHNRAHRKMMGRLISQWQNPWRCFLLDGTNKIQTCVTVQSELYMKNSVQSLRLHHCSPGTVHESWPESSRARLSVKSMAFWHLQ